MITERILNLSDPADAEAYATASTRFSMSDVQHALFLVRSAAIAENGTSHAVYVSNGHQALLYPFVLRNLRHYAAFKSLLPDRPLFDAVTPFEYGGIQTATDDSWPLLGKNFLGVLNDFFAERGVVSEFLRFNPFFPIPPGLEAQYEIVKVHDSVYIDTSQTVDAITAAADRSVRKNLRRAQQECGLTFAEVSPGQQELSDFARLYHATMSRTQAKPYYFFSLSYFQQVLADAKHAALFQIQDPEGAVLASSILLYKGLVAHHFLTGSDDAALLKRPNDLMLIGLSDWCHGKGITKLHLGGGPAPIRSYKQRFSSCTVPYSIGHRIIDSKAYDALTRHRFADSPPTGFKPAYRFGL